MSLRDNFVCEKNKKIKKLMLELSHYGCDIKFTYDDIIETVEKIVNWYMVKYQTKCFIKDNHNFKSINTSCVSKYMSIDQLQYRTIPELRFIFGLKSSKTFNPENDEKEVEQMAICLKDSIIDLACLKLKRLDFTFGKLRAEELKKDILEYNNDNLKEFMPKQAIKNGKIRILKY